MVAGCLILSYSFIGTLLFGVKNAKDENARINPVNKGKK